MINQPGAYVCVALCVLFAVGGVSYTVQTFIMLASMYSKNGRIGKVSSGVIIFRHFVSTWLFYVAWLAFNTVVWVSR